jgi:hypothetical protein
MKRIWAICEVLLTGLTFIVWMATLPIASKVGVEAMVATTLLPGISQAYWIATADTPPHPLTFLCEVWLVLFVILIYARGKALQRRTVQPAH